VLSRRDAQSFHFCEAEMSDKLITLFSHYEEKVRQFHLGRIPVEMIDGPRNEIIARIKAADVTKYVPREATPAMIEAARAFRVNLQFGNQGISGPISPFEAKEIWERMYEAATAQQCEGDQGG
jgi:hypothetical protein